MMPYIIIIKVRKFHQSTINRFGTAGKKPVGGGGVGGNSVKKQSPLFVCSIPLLTENMIQTVHSDANCCIT